MRTYLQILAVFAATLIPTGAAWGQGTDRYAKTANQLVELINAGDYAAIQAKFTREMGAALPLDKSTAFFRGLKQQVGTLQKLGEPRSAPGAMVFPATCEKGALDMQITLDNRGLIAGLSFKPQAATKPGPAKLPAQPSLADRCTKVANQLKELINAGDFAGIQAKFTKEMGAALPLDKSAEFFKGLTQQVGKIQKFGKPRTVGEAMVFPTEFEKETLDMQITLDSRGLIAGLEFAPHVAP
jgi:hypothetical protein